MYPCQIDTDVEVNPVVDHQSKRSKAHLPFRMFNCVKYVGIVQNTNIYLVQNQQLNKIETHKNNQSSSVHNI